MKKSVFIISAAFSALCVFLTAASLSAQEETPETLYARGVSLFFNDRYDEAEACFRKGIELSPDNPANYYFLGVAQLRLGRAEEAGESFAKGAEAELTPRGRLVDVPGHLLRIQGDERLLIEQIRRRAALEYQEKTRRFNEALFGCFTKDDGVVALAPVFAHAVVWQFPGLTFNRGIVALIHGIGNAWLSFVFAFLDAFLLRIVLSWLFGVVMGMGLKGFILGYGLASYGIAVPGLIYYFFCPWHKRGAVTDA